MADRLRYGLLGNPLSRSPSPAMQNAAFHAAGLDAIYEKFERPSLESAKKFFESLPFEKISGINVTVPYKTEVYRWMIERGDELDRQVKLTCSVNTVIANGKKFKGHSTDGYGFITSLKEKGVTFKGKKALLLGAGGAAQAIAIALKEEGASFVGYYYIRMKRLHILEDLLLEEGSDGRREKEFYIGLKELSERYLPSADILVNATPVGQFSFVEERFLHPGLVVCDLLYQPEGTVLLKQAKAKALLAIDGRGMLLHQGARSFELWTGKKPPLAQMQRALEEALT